MGESIRVLVVEDSADDAALLLRALQRGGYDPVYEIVDTPEAMADALDRQEWDLVISDYSMPHFSGLDALKLLQAKDADLSLILLTGQVGEEVAVEAMKAGASDYILKSNPARLIPAVERELRDTRARRKNRQNEQALLESRERYRLIVETANEGIWQVDDGDRTTFVNQKMAEMLGYSIEEIMGRTHYSFMEEEWANLVKANKEERRRGFKGQGEYKLRRKDGTELWAIISVFAIFRNDGSYAGLIGMHTDITERKLSEEAQIQSEEKYRSLVANLNEVVFTLDAESNVTYISPVIERFAGYNSTEIIGKSFTNYVHPDDLQDLVASFRQALAGQSNPDEYRLLRKDGAYVYVRSNSRIFTENGRVNLIGVLSDITGRKRAEEELRYAHQQLAQIIEFLPDATFVIDNDRKVIAWNRAIEEMTGVGQGSMIGKGDYAYAVPFYGEPRPLLIDLVQVEDSSTALKYEYTEKVNTTIYAEAFTPCLYQGRGAWLWGTASPLVDDEGNIVGAIESIRDMTERRRTEDELAKHRERLEELVAERTTDLLAVNQELEAFTHSVSHDLHAPLRRINDFSQILLNDYADSLDRQGSEYLERLQASSQHMSRLIDDLLDLSRVTRADMSRQQTDLSAMARVITGELLNEQPERQARFDIQEEIMVSGDPNLLNMLLQNLLENAWKFTSKKAETRISFGITEYQGRQVYYVRDNGAGFDMAYVDKLFEPFQRLHSTKEYPGTGIGLASVKRIIRRHGGQIWAEGEVDHGATFYFTLK